MRRATLALTLCLLALPAVADIYKCRLPNGETEISNVPCARGSGTLAARPDEPVTEASRQQAERDVERMREYVERREAAQRAETGSAQQAVASQRQAASPAPRSYGDPDACLRELDQQVLEATQRAYLEAECRRLVRPPATTTQQPVVPVYVPYGVPHPPHVLPPPPAPPAKPAAPSGLPTVICPPSNKGCR